MKNQFFKIIFTGLVSLFLCNYTYGQSPVSISPSNVQPNVPCTFTYNGNALTAAWYVAEQGALNYPMVSYVFVGNGNSLTHTFGMAGTYFVLMLAGNDSILTPVFVHEPPGVPKSNYGEQNCNIVSNYSFENYNSVPTVFSQIKKFPGWFDARDSYATFLTTDNYDFAYPEAGTSDGFHRDYNFTPLNPYYRVDVPENFGGFEEPSAYYEQGDGYAGIYTASYSSKLGEYKNNYSEYLIQKLATPMTGGNSYTVRFFVSLSDGSKWATGLGALFTVGEPVRFQAGKKLSQNPNTFVPYNPQISSIGIISDSQGWTEITGIVNVPIGQTYNYMTIGNFEYGPTTQKTPNPNYDASKWYSDDSYMTYHNNIPGQLPANLYTSLSSSYYYIDEVTVIPHTCCITDKSFGTDLNSVTYTSQLNMSPGQSASIIGNLVVNSPQFTMNNLNLKFAPGSKITVPAGTKLQVVNGSVLEACTEMWQGIDAPGEVLVFKATIRDAHSALNFTSGSVWNIQNSVLENNRRHIFVNCPAQAGFFTTSIIKSNLLRCNPSQMKPPFANQYTYNAIELINVRTLYVGAAGPVAGRNEISNAYRGIYAEKAAALYVRNNHFENIKCHNLPGIVCGKGTDLNVAILVNAPKLTDPLSSLYAGINGNILARNTFNNCTGGIYGIGNVYAELYLNNMSQIRDYGIYAMNNNKVNNMLLAQENTISHAKTGIYVYNPGNRPVWVLLNNINKLDNLNSQPTYGIRLENPLASSQAAVIINGNTVSKYRFGIHLSQFTSPRVTNNTVFTDANATAYPEGIRADNSPKAYIAQNSITENGSGAGQSIGIRVEYSPAMSVICNNIHQNHISMFFGAQQTGSTVGANYMYNGKQGIYINYGNIGPQGQGKDPHMNAWIGNTWNSHLHNYASSITGHGDNSQFNLKYFGTIFWPNPLLKTRNALAVPFIPIMPVQNNNPVPSFVTNCRGNLDNPDGLVEQLFTDSASLGDSLLFREEIEWYRDLNLYRAVKEDTTGLLDASLYQYKADIEFTVTGRLDASKDSALAGNFIYAENTIGAVSTDKEVEQKLKEVYAGTFTFLADTSEYKRLAESDSLLLYQLAAECPYRFGEAVYTARNVLMAVNPDTLFISTCEDVDWMLEKSGSTSFSDQSQTLARVYPNPSADDFVVKLAGISEAEDTEVLVTDIHGRERGSFYIYRGADMVLIPGIGLEPGVYVCTIKINGQTVETLKITKQ